MTLVGMFQTYLTTYPWDLIDGDLGANLDRLQGEVGVTGVSVWMATPPVVEVRGREVEPRVFRTRGGLFFHPVEERYEATRCKPIVSTWAKPKDPLERIARACEERGLALRVMISTSQTSRLAERQPEMACKNLYGDSSRRSVCLSNADVQAYLDGLVRDLSSRGAVEGVTLADFVTAWGEALGGGLVSSGLMDDLQRVFLALCFCESCQQGASSAGVDVQSARRSAQVHLARCLEGSSQTDAAFDSVLANDEPLAAYQRWRERELSALSRKLANGCEVRVRVDRRVEGLLHLLPGQLEGGAEVSVISRIDRADQLPLVRSMHPECREIGISGPLVIGAQAPDLVSLFARVVELGFDGVEIDDYGLMSDSALTPIKQAIRYARRSVGV